MVKSLQNSFQKCLAVEDTKDTTLPVRNPKLKVGMDEANKNLRF